MTITKNSNYVLNRKVLFIDSNDRDVNKWPSASEFEISCPSDYTNVESIRLLNIQLPSFYYNISEELQTNKFVIQLNDGSKETIILQDGNYNNEDLVNSIQFKLQEYNSSFKVVYNSVTNKIYIANSDISFSLLFNEKINYSNCSNYVFDQHSKWGLGYIMGFDKKVYSSYNVNDEKDITTNDIIFSHISSVPWISGDENSDKSAQIIKSEKCTNLFLNEFIYIELEKYNTCDEIKPFLYYNHNNSNAGIINSAFAKIPILPSPYNQSLANDGYLENVSFYQPPIEKIRKFKLKFRYHNGMSVNFNNYNITLALEINQIRNEILDYNVRTPFKL